MLALTGAAGKQLVVSLVLFICVGLLFSSSARSDGPETDKAKAAVSDKANTNASDAAKKRQEAMQKQLDAARAAYEKENREIQERLDKDPLWHPSHEQVAVIKMEERSQGRRINSFCRDKEGNLLVCLAARPPSKIDTVAGKGPAPADRGSIAKVSPEGKTLATWNLQIEPQAICLSGGGQIYVGGSGKLCKLGADGKVLVSVDSPVAAGLPPLPEFKKQPVATGPEAKQPRRPSRRKSPTCGRSCRRPCRNIRRLPPKPSRD